MKTLCSLAHQCKTLRAGAKHSHALRSGRLAVSRRMRPPRLRRSSGRILESRSRAAFFSWLGLGSLHSLSQTSRPVRSMEPTTFPVHPGMDCLQIKNGLIKCGVRIPNRRIKSGHPMRIEFNAGEAVATSFSIKRTLHHLDASLVWFAAQQRRKLAVCHPNLRHGSNLCRASRSRLPLNW